MHVHRLLVALAALAAAVSGPAGAAEPVIAPGTYVQINSVTKKALNPGNQAVFVRGKTGKLSFSVNAIRQLDQSQGFVAGTLSGSGPVVIWTQKAEGLNCRLTFTALAGGLRIAQDSAFGDCGFGSGVIADGLYVKAATNGKLGAPVGP